MIFFFTKNLVFDPQGIKNSVIMRGLNENISLYNHVNFTSVFYVLIWYCINKRKILLLMMKIDIFMSVRRVLLGAGGLLAGPELQLL